MNKPKQPVRLEKEETISVMEFLNEGKTIHIKNWVLLIAFVVIFFILCFIVKGPTYGYL